MGSKHSGQWECIIKNTARQIYMWMLTWYSSKYKPCLFCVFEWINRCEPSNGDALMMLMLSWRWPVQPLCFLKACWKGKRSAEDKNLIRTHYMKSELASWANRQVFISLSMHLESSGEDLHCFSASLWCALTVSTHGSFCTPVHIGVTFPLIIKWKWGQC